VRARRRRCNPVRGGGGRDRDGIVRHTLAVEQDWARKVGVSHTRRRSRPRRPGSKGVSRRVRKAIRTYHSEGRMARTWPLRYLIRPHRVSHDGPRLGNGRQKSHRLNNERRKAIQRALCALIHLTSVSREVETRVVVPSGSLQGSPRLSGKPPVHNVAVMGRFNLETHSEGSLR